MTACEHLSRLNKPAILTIILASYVMIVLDTSVVLTGLPNIHRDLGFTDTGLAWVQSAYTLTFGGFLLLGGRAGDIIGRRRMLLAGLVVFTASSLAIGVAQSPGWIVAARAVQGIGAAILAPATLALLQTTFVEGEERVRAVSYYSAVAGVAASVGLVVGGVLAEWVSWRMGFFINLPIGVAMIVATLRYVPESGRRSGAFDIVGALTSTIGATALVYGFIRAATAGWTDAIALGSFAGAAILLIAFVVNEWRVAQPIMPLRLFASRERTGAYAARFLFLAAMIGFFFFTTLYLQQVLGLSPAATGIAFLPMTLVNFVVAMAVPALTRRFGNGRLLGLGLSISIVGLAWLSRATLGTDYLTGVALPMALIGIGQGLALSPMTSAGVAGVNGADAGAASGVLNVFHQMGNSLGLAVLVALAQFGAGGLSGAALLAHRFTIALTGATGFMALAVVVVMALIVRLWPVTDAPGAKVVIQ
ncbi:MAG: MFS transporter [Rhodopseudomonas sp.]|nr:MFS transporter [Rhodopseudomonas sp.]